MATGSPDSSSPASAAKPGSREEARAGPTRLLKIAIAIGAVIFAVVIARNMGAYAGASDQSGYLTQARLLRDGQIRAPLRTVPGFPREDLTDWAFVPLGFVANSDHTLTPTYPIGLPLLVIATSWVTGWEAAPHVTMWLHALAGVALVFALARVVGLSEAWAALGALILATSPVYLFMALTLLSDVPALVWTALAVLFAWRSRAHAAWALAAGAALAFAVFIRPTNLLVLAPIGITLGLSGRRWAALIAGGLPGAIAFAAYNHAAYGSAFVTGYGSVWSAFSAAWGPTTLGHYARWLPVALTPAVGLALGLPWIARNRCVAMLTMWALVFTGFYLFYAVTHEAWWCLRFVLPAFPPLIIAALLVARKISDAPRFARWHRHASVGWTIGVGLVLAWSLRWNAKLAALHSGHDQRNYAEATTWARTHLPAGAVLVSMATSGALYHYTDFNFIRWEHLQPRHIPALEQIAADKDRPLVAVLFAFEEEEVLRQRLPGQWEKIHANRDATLWRRVVPARPSP